MSRLALFFLFLVPVLFATSPVRAEDVSRPAIAMHGEPKYKPGFTHFDYANLDVPKGGTIKFGFTGTFDSLNPFNIIGQPPIGLSLGFLSLVYQSLMARCWDEPFTLYGLLAESAVVPDDRSSITFTIDAKARWQDGPPVTADDVLFSWHILKDNGRPNMRFYYRKVAKAEKTGPRSVTFTFAHNPDGSLNREMPLIMALMPILPQHAWKDRDITKGTWQLPVGSGPYRLSAVDPGRSVAYTRDANYWGRDIPSQRGLYNFDAVRIDYYRDDNIALEAFKAGSFDLRREYDAKKWATGYDTPALHDGRIRQEGDEYKNTAPAYGFILNTRRAPLDDPALRAALEYTFDFDWINKTLFYGQDKRTTSFFPNSDLAAPPLPEGKELALLDKYRAQLPPELFTKPMTPPALGPGGIRDNLLEASAMLRKAGYSLHDNQLYAPGSNKPVRFEILLTNPSEEKVALEWKRLLERIGVGVYVHTVDSAQYEQRMRMFDFDITANQWPNTQSPGNEQITFWGSAAADTPGSRNYAGIENPVIDALAAAVPVAATREDLLATVHALDRVLMAGHYMVPLYYSSADRIAYWTAHLRHPAALPLYGSVLESWWYEKTAQ